MPWVLQPALSIAATTSDTGASGYSSALVLRVRFDAEKKVVAALLFDKEARLSVFDWIKWRLRI
jgi:hypothetical protein